ncbi:MAG: DUF1778 domain-containing protein [Candidatus Cybelea sp.]
MPATLHRRSGRISLRVTAEQKDFIARAAALETGGDLTRFIADAALRAAHSVIEEHGVSQVTDSMRRRFYDLLINPPQPTDDLVALMAAGAPGGFAVDD